MSQPFMLLLDRDIEEWANGNCSGTAQAVQTNVGAGRMAGRENVRAQ